MMTPDEFFKNARQLSPEEAQDASNSRQYNNQFLKDIYEIRQKMYRDQSILANQIVGSEVY
jgi:hypothetical protein